MLQHTPPIEHRERRIFTVVRGMLRSGDYLVPRLGTETHLNKPPLYYWLAAGITRATKLPDRIAYRLPSILAALGLIACVFWFCRALGAQAIALSAALTIPALSIFYGNARIANHDMLLSALFLGFAAWLFLLAIYHGRAEVWYSRFHTGDPADRRCRVGPIIGGGHRRREGNPRCQ